MTTCLTCQAPLVRRKKEAAKVFQKRKYCSFPCAQKGLRKCWST